MWRGCAAEKAGTVERAGPVGGGVRKSFPDLSQPLQVPERLATATLACWMRQVVTNHYVALVNPE
jgi:hypothetical protein